MAEELGAAGMGARTERINAALQVFEAALTAEKIGLIAILFKTPTGVNHAVWDTSLSMAKKLYEATGLLRSLHEELAPLEDEEAEA